MKLFRVRAMNCRIKGIILAAFVVVLYMTCLQSGIKLPPLGIFPQGDGPLQSPRTVDHNAKSPQKLSAHHTVVAKPEKSGAPFIQSQIGGRELFANNILIKEVTGEDNQERSSAQVHLGVTSPTRPLPLDSQTTTANLHYAEEEQKTRIENLKSQCRRLNTASWPLSRQNMTEFYYSRKYNFAYCKVPKSGSTFWMKLFMILLKGDAYSSVMARWSRADIHAKSRMLVASPFKIMQSHVPTVVVSRNPYTRLYSAYIDKAFLPLFWERFAKLEGSFKKKTYFVNSTQMVLRGSKAALQGRYLRYQKHLMERGMLERRNVSTRITPICANNVTFEQFLVHVIADSKSRKLPEPHWAPISHLCHPCRFNTFKIVKQEDFSYDVEQTLRSVDIKLGDYPSIHDTLYENRAQNSIPGIISVIESKAFSRNVNECISQREVVSRAWKSLQIQGFIRDEDHLPEYILKEVTFNKTKVTEAVLNAIKRNPMTPKERQKQRRLHLVNAYKTVSKNIIQQLQAVYRMDFLLFNYSDAPPS